MGKIICISMLIGMLLSGCKSLQTAHSSSVTDSTVTERIVTIRDTVLITEVAHVKDTIKSPCADGSVPNFKPVLKQDKNAKLTAKVVGKNIVVDCLCDSMAIKAQLIDTYEGKLRMITSAKNTTEIKREKYVPGWVQFFAITGAISWLLAIIIGISFIARLWIR